MDIQQTINIFLHSNLLYERRNTNLCQLLDLNTVTDYLVCFVAACGEIEKVSVHFETLQFTTLEMDVCRRRRLRGHVADRNVTAVLLKRLRCIGSTVWRLIDERSRHTTTANIALTL